jgi:menaquinone-9 beta-reductase
VDKTYDLIIVGGGPAGSVSALASARAGARVLVLERARFPRDKVCGDCLNPECWDVFDRLGLTEEVRALPHAVLDRVSFVARSGRTVGFEMEKSERGEIAVRRRYLDELLLKRAAQAGAEICENATVTTVMRESGRWQVGFSVQNDMHCADAPQLIAADGRNSTVARLLGLRARRGLSRHRVGLQTHVPLPASLAGTVQMRWLDGGYGGLAPVGNGLLNVSLAGRPGQIEALKAWAVTEFGAIDEWRTIAPLARQSFSPAHADGWFLVGDAARVVEPFTGEGIYYAMRSGELAAAAVIDVLAGRTSAADMARRYRAAHERLYRGRLWVNRLAKAAVLHPRLAGALLRLSGSHPGWLRHLTAKVVGPLRA